MLGGSTRQRCFHELMSRYAAAPRSATLLPVCNAAPCLPSCPDTILAALHVMFHFPCTHLLQQVTAHESLTTPQKSTIARRTLARYRSSSRAETTGLRLLCSQVIDSPSRCCDGWQAETSKCIPLAQSTSMGSRLHHLSYTLLTHARVSKALCWRFVHRESCIAAKGVFLSCSTLASSTYTPPRPHERH